MSQSDSSLGDIQHDIDRTRARIVDTLDALQAKLSPGQVLDQALGYARSGGAETAENLARHVRENPLPALLLGVSLAWLMKGPSRATGPDRRLDRDLERAMSRTSDTATNARERVSQGMEQASRSASRLAAAAQDGAATVRDGVREAREKAQAGARDLGDRSRRAADSAVGIARDAADFAVHHPLVLGLVGLSIGAAIGAATLSTPRGREAVGRVGERIGDAAQDARERVVGVSGDMEGKMRQIRDAVAGEESEGGRGDAGRSGASVGDGHLPGEPGMDKTGAPSTTAEPPEQAALGGERSGRADQVSSETRH